MNSGYYTNPNLYSTITDGELDIIVQHIILQTSRVIGSQLVYRHCKTKDIEFIDEGFVQVWQDWMYWEIGNWERWVNMIPHSVYSVKGPNSFWHMDGNLKLRDYGFVSYVAIDGYFRRVIYLECNTNNRAETVLSAFLKGAAGHL